MVPSYIGAIDEYKSGCLMGWVCDVNAPAKHVQLDVYAGSSLLGSGVADHYRGDLLQLGLGDCNSGFKIKLNGVTEYKKVRLVERTSNNPLVIPEFKIELSGIVNEDRDEILRSEYEKLVIKARDTSRLKRIECVNNLEFAESIELAYQVLQESWEQRTEFRKLKLDKVEEPDVTIIIPVHNKFELTYHCVASLILAYNKASFDVIIIDDVSTDETINIHSYVDNIEVIKNQKNLGFLRNCNLAAERAKGDYIVMLNNDTEVTSGWLDELIAEIGRAHV